MIRSTGIPRSPAVYRLSEVARMALPTFVFLMKTWKTAMSPKLMARMTI